jgi:hypothetical protein
MDQYKIWNKFIPNVNPEILRRCHSMCSCRTFLTLSCNRTSHGPCWLNRHSGCSQFHPPWEVHYPDSFALFSSAAPNAEPVPQIRSLSLASYYQSLVALKSRLLTTSPHKHKSRLLTTSPHKHKRTNTTQVPSQPSAVQHCVATM